jgi:hypothetical protein
VKIERYRKGRYFALYDDAGNLVVVTVYKRGAQEVLRRLCASQPEETAAAVSPYVSERIQPYGNRG